MRNANLLAGKTWDQFKWSRLPLHVTQQFETLRHGDFKTMKYRPEFPGRFGSFEDALSYCRSFFEWYNDEHYHSGIGHLTPTMLHYGKADQVFAERAQVLQEA